MRLSPLCLAISLTLLAGCNPQATRTENAAATTVESEAEIDTLADAEIKQEQFSIANDERDTDDGSSVQGAAAASGQMRAARERENVASLSVAKANEPAAKIASLEGRRQDALTRSEVTSAARAAKSASTGYAMPSPVYAPAPPAMMKYAAQAQPIVAMTAPQNTENYATHVDNPIHRVSENSVSTFSIDVDTGSYSNVRRMLMAGQRPPADAVRAEEMINYFDYGYAAPKSRSVPFLVSTEIATAPWNNKHQLLQIGIQGYQVSKAEIPASNIVFLIDTSGSMQDQDKLPLLKQSFAALVEQLRPQDRVTMVVYAGSAGLVLPPTAGNEREKILAALGQLQAGGSTNGGEGLALAYAMARQAFIKNGVNRVVLATDGDFNVGTFDQKALETMIADQRKSGIALTTLGFGTGNYNDTMAEQLADLGNGNHAYIDSINEGRKVLVEELSSTMLTIAQDVKIQLEFNPAVVAEYRLIGYENRALRREDFNNDKVDAGEIGAGHDVTALYEITLVNSGGESVDPLRYGRKSAPVAASDEIGWLRLRYKQPGAETSRLIENALTRRQIRQAASPRLRWSAAVAAYADLLRGGKNIGSLGWNQVHALAASAGGNDRWGYRAEFLTLVDKARAVTGGDKPIAVSE
jgi:Ca-activated chloride channel family protein